MRTKPISQRKELNVNNFTCKRLKEVSDNKNIKGNIKTFLSSKNPGLGKYLHYCAKPEESNNYRAFYVILDDEDVVMYFSLQMGATIKCHKKNIGGIKFNSEYNEYRIDDDKIEVTSVVPVIEIPQLCINDRYKNKVKSWKVDYNGCTYNVGQFVFYKYIVPIVLDVAEKVGLQYLILFCADNETGDLEKYYKSMGFERMDNMACLRDSYSANLECLIIKLGDLILRYLKFENPNYETPKTAKFKYNRWTFVL